MSPADRHMLLVVITFAELQLALEGRLTWKFPEGTTIADVRESMVHGGMLVVLKNDKFPGVAPYLELPHATTVLRYNNGERCVLEVRP